MEKLEIAVEVLENLKKECGKDLDSEHFGARYSAEAKIRSICIVKEKIEDMINEE